MDAIVTIVIPVYNGEKYVSRAVQSILDQPQGQHVRVLLINDGSTDSSGRICDGLAEKHSNVRVIHKENGGVSSARNLGIENADTKYIGFLDCDDWWEPNFFDGELLSELSGSNSFDMYQFAYQGVDHSISLKKINPLNTDIYIYIYREWIRSLRLEPSLCFPLSHRDSAS